MDDFAKLSAEIAKQNERFKPWFDFSTNLGASGALAGVTAYSWKLVFGYTEGGFVLLIILFITALLITIFTLTVTYLVWKMTDRIADTFYLLFVLEKFENLKSIKKQDVRFFPFYILIVLLYMAIRFSAVLVAFLAIYSALGATTSTDRHA